MRAFSRGNEGSGGEGGGRDGREKVGGAWEKSGEGGKGERTKLSLSY